MDNANFIVLFKQDLKNINHIYNDHVSNDMSKDEFRNLCKEVWKKPHGFVVIDITSEIQKRFEEILHIGCNKILFCSKKWKTFLEKSRKTLHLKICFS